MIISKKVARVKAKIAERVTGVWIPAHTDKGHFYLNGDIKVDSVTGVLGTLSKPHLLPWSIKVALEHFIAHLEDWNEFSDEENRKSMFRNAQFAYTAVRDDAGQTGTFVHSIAEVYLLEWIENGIPREDICTLIPEGTDGRVYAGARSVELFFKTNEYIPIASELLVGSTKVGSAGTLDMLVLDKSGNPVLLDWKTSNSFQEDNYSLQVSAYAKFFQEMTGIKIAKVIVVMLSKDYAKIKEYEILNVNETYKIFKYLVKIYQWIHAEGNKSTDNRKRISI